MTRFSLWVLPNLLLAASSVLAQAPAPSPSTTPATSATTSLPAADTTEGEVRKVDLSAGKITLKHGEIKNMEMPPMTMVFKVQDPALLSQVKAGDKVRFTVDKIKGAYTVLTLEPVQ